MAIIVYVLVVMCPKNTDPWVNTAVDRVIGWNIHSVNNSTQLEGSIGIKLYGVTSYLALANMTNDTCVAALETSDQIGRVACGVSIPDPYTVQITLTFLSWPSTNIPDNNIYTNDDNPAITDFSCDVSQVALPASAAHNSTILCQFYDVVSENIKGNV